MDRRCETRNWVSRIWKDTADNSGEEPVLMTMVEALFDVMQLSNVPLSIGLYTC